jgi:hypothetical protein
VNTTRFVMVAVTAIVLGISSLPVSDPSAFAPSFLDTVSVCPDSTWRAEGEVFSVGVCISAGLTGVMGYSFVVTFDSSVIEILNAAEGPLPQSAGNTFFWWFNSGVKSDSVRVNGAVLGGTMDGPGELVTLTFLAKTHGVVRTTDVVIAQSQLRDGANQPIGHEKSDGFVQIDPVTGIETPPVESGFFRCYPNPFNPSVTLVFAPPDGSGSVGGSRVTVGLYDAGGRIVRTLFDGRMNPGGGTFRWDGTDGGGNNVASGVYFAVAETDRGAFRTKIVLVR